MTGQDLPEAAAIAQAWLTLHVGSSAPVIQVRPDASLFVETESGLFEACALAAGQGADDPVRRGSLFCLSRTGERHFYQPAPEDTAVVVSRKPAGSAMWSFERWQDGVLDLATDDRANAAQGPGPSDPEVDPLLLRWLWPQTDVSSEDVAQRLGGVSLRTMRRRAFAVGVPTDRFQARRERCDRAVLLELWGEPTLTKAAICERLGIPPPQLARIARRLEMPERPRVSTRPRRSSSTAAPNRPGSNETAAAALRVANQHRTREALESMLDRTRAALSLPASEVPHHLREAGELRLRHPQESLAEVAELGGCSKDVLTGRLRRLWQLADQQQTAPTS